MSGVVAFNHNEGSPDSDLCDRSVNLVLQSSQSWIRLITLFQDAKPNLSSLRYPVGMVLLCPQCNRPSAAQREKCIYCGAALPQGAVASEEERSLPTDLDQLVRQAMTLGTTHRLESALRAHQQAPSTPSSAKQVDEEVASDVVSRTERLLEMQQACVDAVSADASEDEGALAEALHPQMLRERRESSSSSSSPALSSSSPMLPSQSSSATSVRPSQSLSRVSEQASSLSSVAPGLAAAALSSQSSSQRR